MITTSIILGTEFSNLSSETVTWLDFHLDRRLQMHPAGFWPYSSKTLVLKGCQIMVHLGWIKALTWEQEVVSRSLWSDYIPLTIWNSPWLKIIDSKSHLCCRKRVRNWYLFACQKLPKAHWNRSFPWHTHDTLWTIWYDSLSYINYSHV